MLTAPAGVTAYVNAQNTAWRGDLYSLTLIDTSVFRWTTADRDLLVGGNTYLANGAVLGRSNTRVTSQLETDTVEVQLAGAALVNGKTIALQSILGLFDEARLQVDLLVGQDAPSAIANGAVKAWFEGKVAGIDPDAQLVRMQVESDLATLGVMLPQRPFQLGCSYAVYDPNCTLSKAAFTLTGSATGGTTTTVTTTAAAIIAKANGYFNLGVLFFTSGALNGSRRSIRDFQVSGGIATFTLGIPLPSAPLNGDGISAYPGCNRTTVACGPAKFNNFVNFGNFPHIPTPEGGL